MSAYDDRCILSSGNVFADLGLPEPENDRTKANLIHRVADIIRLRELSQSQAASLLEIDQPKVSAIMRGKISGFSTDRLLRYLALLGYSVCISISQEREERGNIRVQGP